MDWIISVLHYLLEFFQTHVHWVGDAIQLSHHLFPHSFFSCPQSFPASGSFPGISSSHQVIKVLEFQLQYQSFQWIFRVNFLYYWLVWPSYCPGNSQEPYMQHQSDQIRSDQSLSHIRLFATPWIAALQTSLPITNSRSSRRLTSIESVMPSSHLILCRPLLLLPPVPLSIRVFSNESALCMRWPKYWSFSFSISPSKGIPGLISFRMDWLDLLAVQRTLE